MEKTTYTFPSEAEIIERIQSEFDWVGSDFGHVIARFARQTADCQLVAAGVNLAFWLAVGDIEKTEGSSPMLAAMFNMVYEDIMTALFVDNPDFGAEVIAVFAEVTS